MTTHPAETVHHAPREEPGEDAWWMPTPDGFAACALSATARTVPEARRFTRATLEGWKVCAGLADDAVLVVSELVSNALRHGFRNRSGERGHRGAHTLLQRLAGTDPAGGHRAVRGLGRRPRRTRHQDPGCPGGIRARPLYRRPAERVLGLDAPRPVGEDGLGDDVGTRLRLLVRDPAARARSGPWSAACDDSRVAVARAEGPRSRWICCPCATSVRSRAGSTSAGPPRNYGWPSPR